MRIFKAITLLNNDAIVLVDNLGNKFQKYSDKKIFVTYNRDILNEEEKDTIGSTIKNDEFIEKYNNSEFQILEQWYQHDFEFPILCWVTTPDWQFSKKLVLLNSRGSKMFNTGFGESYIISFHNKIVPLTDNEIEELKQGIIDV